MDDLDLDAIEARANAASPGPWKCWNGWGPLPDGDMAMQRIGPNAFEGGLHSAGRGDDMYATVEDAEFVALARTDVPALVAEVRRLREGAS